MAYTINHSINNNLVVFALSGYIEQEACAQLLEDFKKLNQNYKKFIFDFSEVTIVNSVGLSQLLDIFSQKLSDSSLEFGICNLNHATQYSFKIVGLFNLANEYPNNEAAITALS